VIGRARRGAIAAIAAISIAAGALATVRPADAQRVDPRRPTVLVVGAPGGPSPTFRGDARRSGTTKDLLPSGALRIAWRKTIGLNIDQPALVSSDGTIAIVTATRGDVIFLDADGEERGRVSAGASSAGGATMTSDGTVVFTTSSGDAVGIRRTSASLHTAFAGPSQVPRYVTRIGGERNVRTSPISLDDGGVVVAAASDLVVLDAEGNVRARVSLPEAPAAPLLTTGDKIIAVTSTGAVYGWTPGREVVRLGSFGAPIDGGAALADASTLVAVIEGNHLVELDLGRGARTSRSIAAQGLYLGPPSVRTVAGVAGGGTLATLLAETPSRAFVVSIDAAGQEASRVPVATLTPKTLPDGGAAPLAAGGHTGPLVDARGAVAFAAPEDGHVGVIGPDGAVDTVGELICTRTSRSSGVAGLTSLGRGAFAVTCESGAIAKIVGGP
jgi:hypothetical protein